MFSSLTESVQTVLRSTYGIEDSAVELERPQDPEHGDVALPIAMQVAKAASKPPREIAESISAALSKLSDVEKVEVAGPGYVNVWLTPEALIAALGETREACTAQVKKKGGKPNVIEYSSPNIAKPLGIHHILSTVIGQAIFNLNRHLGYEAIAVNHLGDWGTQYGKLAVAVAKWGEKPVEECTLDDLLPLYVKFHEEAEKHPELEKEAQGAFKKMEEGDSDLRAFRETVVAITMKEINKTYERLHVSFDHVHGESIYQDMMMPILEEGKVKGVFKEGRERALIVEFPEDTNMPPAIVLKGDGATIYLTRDFATVKYRYEQWHPEAIYYVVDVSHTLYYQQLFHGVEQMGWDIPHLEHVVFGRMRFADGSMSTRKGNIVRLEEVLDEAVKRAEAVIAEHGEKIQTEDRKDLAEMMGTGAVVYGVLSQNRKMDIVFDWDRMLSFDGNSAPYVQYTHARTKSVLRNAGDGTFEAPKKIETLSVKERTLIGTLLRFRRVLEEARGSHMPHILANYLYALCKDYNTFYNEEPILKAPEPARSLRLALTADTAAVLKVGAEILTIRVPDRM